MPPQLNPSFKAIKQKPSLRYYVLCTIFSSVVALFYLARTPELISMATMNPMHGIMMVAAVISCISLFVMPPSQQSAVMRRIGLIIMVLYALKTEMDENLVKLARNTDFTGKSLQ